VKSYKLGLGQGLCERLLNATEKLENSHIGKNLIPAGNFHDRYMEAMEKFINDNRVSYIIQEIDENEAFHKGLEDAKRVNIKKPLKKKDELELPYIRNRS